MLMSRTPLQQAFQAQPANEVKPLAEADYRGVATASRFSSPREDFAALLDGCGIYDLGFCARIFLAGDDRTPWLTGMVTNNIRDLALGHGLYAFLLNPQGRILGDMHVHNLGESLMVETDRSQVEKITATFDHYIIMDDVDLTDVSQQWTALGLAGPRSRAILNLAGIEVPNLAPLQR